MQGEHPVMLLRARPSTEAREAFALWFRKVHLRDVERIPGISGVTSATGPGGLFFGFYAFEGSEDVQAALSSPQAAYARGTWEQWASKMEELFIEIWAPLGPLPLYHPAN
jgi:hypothetical protein